MAALGLPYFFERRNVGGQFLSWYQLAFTLRRLKRGHGIGQGLHLAL